MIRFESEEKKPFEKVGIKWTIRDMISSAMLAAVFAILIVVVLAYMTKITFSTEIDWKEQGANAILLVFSSVSVTVILRRYGIMKGQNTKEHVEAEKGVLENVGKIMAGHNSGRAAEYCRSWEKKNYLEEVGEILSPYNISLEQFYKLRIYSKKELKEDFTTLTKEQIKAVLRAKKVRVRDYSEDFLLTDLRRKKRHSSPSGGLTTEQRNLIMTGQNVFNSLVMTVIVVSFTINIISEPSLATVVSCLLKILTIVLSGIWALAGGYNLTANIEVDRLKRQQKEQERFIEYCELNKTEAREKDEECMEKASEPPEKALGTA